jgi:soluble lytic murein transglycosylase-like protein
VTRCKSLIAILAIAIVATALATAVTPQKAEAATLGARLHRVDSKLQQARQRLQDAQAALAAALVGSTVAQAPAALAAAPAASTVASPLDQLKAKVVRAQREVRHWERVLRHLRSAFRTRRQLARWAHNGDWRSIIVVAAAKYHVSADGIYRMMIRESNGQRFAGASSAYKGLFQYYTGTWAASWNPYRGASILDPVAQIFATCYAVHRGMGPQMWTTTYSSQY